MAPLTPGVVDQLRRKHPPRRTPMPAELPGVFSRVTVSLTETFRKLRRRRGTGPSGMRNEYLRALVAHFDDPRANQVMPKCSVFWRSWARVIRGRLPAIGRPNADILNHGPPPAYARGQAAVGGAEPWPRVQPSVLRRLRAAAGL